MSRLNRLHALAVEYPNSTTRALAERLGDGTPLPVVSAALSTLRRQGRVRSVAGKGRGSPNTWTADEAPRPPFPPADTYRLLSECVDRGVKYGLRRAYKHTDKPTNEQIEEAVSSAVMGEVAEAFVFPERRT